MKPEMIICQPKFTTREKITFFIQAIRANWFNLLFYSLIVYVPFIPVLKQHDAWLGMVPIALAYGWFIGKCVAERIWLQVEIVDFSQFRRRDRRKHYRKTGVSNKQAKFFKHKFPRISSAFEGIFKK